MNVVHPLSYTCLPTYAGAESTLTLFSFYSKLFTFTILSTAITMENKF